MCAREFVSKHEVGWSGRLGKEKEYDKNILHKNFENIKNHSTITTTTKTPRSQTS